jgi:lysophospholipase L1-like esterase
MFFHAATLGQDQAASFPFLHPKSNVIVTNDAASYDAFLEKLRVVDSTRHGVVRIVQVGDSHLATDFLAGIVRQGLQERFGNAGRGFLIPYRRPQRGEPSGYTVETNVRWIHPAIRRTRRSKPTTSLLPGMAPESSASLTVLLDSSQHFSSATIFHRLSAEYYDIDVRNSAHAFPVQIVSSESNGKMAERVDFPMRGSSLVTSASKGSDQQKYMQISGVALEDTTSGIIYSNIGIVGANFLTYLESDLFSAQIKSLNPDLVIISLGTNDAASARFNKQFFAQHAGLFLTHVRNLAPQASIMLTTPPDSYRRRRRKNPGELEARNQILEICRADHMPVWDLYDVMGGYGVMGQWYKKGLAVKDRVHFSQRGYALQGELFLNALLESYGDYAAGHR